MPVRVGASVRKDRFTTEVPANPLIDPATTASVQPVGQAGWALQMSEEFTGSTVTVTDPTLGYVRFRPGGPQWATWYPNWARFTAQSPGGNHTNTDQDSYYATSKVSLDGASSLVLGCDKQTTVAGLDYTAGMIQSLPGYTHTYGYIEAKIKVAVKAVAGHWPAFWNHNATTNIWPPEIDFWEYYGSEDPKYYENVYHDASNVINSTSTTDPSAWHVYGCRWTSSTVTWFRDGVQTNTTSRTSTVPMFLILNNGTRAPSNPTFASNDMSVDYVRVWR